MFNMKRGAILALVLIVLLAFVPGVAKAAVENPPSPDYNQLLIILSFGIVIIMGAVALVREIRTNGPAKGVELAFGYINRNKRLLDDAEAVLKYVPPEDVEKIQSALDTVALISSNAGTKAAIAQIKLFIKLTTDNLPNEVGGNGSQ